MRFAFYARVSTEDHQDEEASRGWQLRASLQAIEPVQGEIVAEYFDRGVSRSVPWKSRPEAGRLLADLRNPDRGWEAVVMGEAARGFYHNQYSLVSDVFQHFKVDLWVGGIGRIDPDSEAHDMMMSLYGGMSKGERNRMKDRVRTAMDDLAEREGRFLGGRPPFGYKLVDAGPHPNPEKRAAGLKLHALEANPDTAPVVKRIFQEYIGGAGCRAIAQHLAQDGIPSPSNCDPARNRHRRGRGWAHTAVRAILTNERYTGHQVWGRQRREEQLIDPDAPEDGRATLQRWTEPTTWVRSADVVCEPLVSKDLFDQVQAVMRAKGADRARRVRSPRTGTPYLFAGRVICGLCGHKMSGHRADSRLGYRCRLRDDYALPEDDAHPRSVWIPEDQLAKVTFEWLDELFRPDSRDHVLAQLAAVRPHDGEEPLRNREELHDIERRVHRLVDAVERGVFTSAEVAPRLEPLRRRQSQLEANAPTERPVPEESGPDPGAVIRLLDEVGGLVGLGSQLTNEERRQILSAAEFTARYDPGTREVLFKVDLTRGVSARVGGGT